MGFFYKTCCFIFNRIYRHKIYNLDNLPEGPAIIVCNHFCFYDCGLIYNLYHKKFKDDNLYFLAKKEIFDYPIIKKIVKDLNAIPVNRENPDIKSLLSIIRVIKNGNKLVIFPEGTRNKTKTTKIQQLKGGSMVLAVKAKCPVVPIIINKKCRPFRKVHILVGKPFELMNYYDKKLDDKTIIELEDFVKNKMENVQKELEGITKKNANN